MIKIKPFLKALIKENLIYIFGFFILIILNLTLISTGIKKITILNSEITNLSKDLENLNKKVILINNYSSNSKIIEENIYFLNKLIPNSEDYFSIIYSLENLSQKTGFIITQYNINIGTSTSQKIRLSVIGIGDTVSFLNFLKEYNFGGGRLITSNNIELNKDIGDSIKIDLTFYNKKVDIKNQDVIANNYEKIFENLEKIKKRVNFNFDEEISLQNNSTTYPLKNNPF